MLCHLVADLPGGSAQLTGARSPDLAVEVDDNHGGQQRETACKEDDFVHRRDRAKSRNCSVSRCWPHSLAAAQPRCALATPNTIRVRSDV